MPALEFLNLLDPQNIESRFSNQDRWVYPEAATKRTLPISEERLESILQKIPDREIDLINLYYRMEKSQSIIARVLKISQGTISYRLNRALNRIRFLAEYPDISEEKMTKDLELAFGEDPVGIMVMVGMYQTTCQSEVSRQINTKLKINPPLTQVKVRHTFLKNLNTIQNLSKADSKWHDYVKAFDMVKNNLNILREVKNPRWERDERLEVPARRIKASFKFE